eukprot:Lithocolla_globosa_v1_NODE_254_length_4813_cov_30.378310.p1 type:complete len:852 gc:universal NODE_254_length_4813_cov_30.378310:2580-25(-)
MRQYMCMVVTAELRSVEQAVYVLNAVLVGRLAYILQVADVAQKILGRIDTRMRETISVVAGFTKKGTMNTGVFHTPAEGKFELGLGLASIVDLVREMVPSNFQILMCSGQSSLNKIAMAEVDNMSQIAEKNGLTTALLMPFQVLKEKTRSQGGVMRALRIMEKEDITFIPKLRLVEPPKDVPLIFLVSLRVYQRHSGSWRNYGIIGLGDIVTTCGNFLTLEEKYPNILFCNKRPAWYDALKRELCEQDSSQLKPEIDYIRLNPLQMYPTRPPVSKVNSLASFKGRLFRVLRLTFIAGRYVAHVRCFETQPRMDMGTVILRQTKHSEVIEDNCLITLPIYLQTLPHEMRSDPKKVLITDRFVSQPDFIRAICLVRAKEEQQSKQRRDRAGAVVDLAKYGLHANQRIFPNAHMSAELKPAPVVPNPPKCVYYSDGSTSTEDPIIAGFGSLVTEGIGNKQMGLVFGEQTNNKAELLGVMKGSSQAPMNSEVESNTDSKYVCDIWREKVSSEKTTTPRKHLRAANHTLVRMCREFYWQRNRAGGSHRVNKVRAHSDDTPVENITVDEMANIARTRLLHASTYSQIWDLPGWLDFAEPYVAVVKGKVVEGDLRRHLRNIHCREYVAHWRSCRVQGRFRRCEEEWSKTTAVLMGKRCKFNQKALLLKLWTGEFVVEQTLFQWGKLDSPICKLCKEANGTIAHMLLECSALKDARIESKEVLKDRIKNFKIPESRKQNLEESVWGNARDHNGSLGLVTNHMLAVIKELEKCTEVSLLPSIIDWIMKHLEKITTERNQKFYGLERNESYQEDRNEDNPVAERRSNSPLLSGDALFAALRNETQDREERRQIERLGKRNV